MTNFLDIIRRWLKDPNAIKLIEVGISILIITSIFRFLNKALPRLVQDGDMRYRLRKAISFCGYILILLYVVLVFSDRLGRITVIVGAIGAGVAFALQEVIASFAGWVAISLGQFYKPGDRVELGGIMGDVIDISLLRTTLMECGDWVKADLYNGRIVRIANSFVFKEPVFNYSGDFPFVWDEVSIPIEYGSDRQLARDICQKVVNEVVKDYIPLAKLQWQHMVQKYLIEDATIEPVVTLVATDNWLEFTIRYIVDYKCRRGTKDRLFTGLLDEFDRTSGRVTIASQTVHLVKTPILDVRLNNR
ncbi:MAG TPA: mechanosensitive ion channel [Oscillatoriales cyanobacterium M59_W2019_021]|nr:MAG: mechanosensitive ion channel family protein [Cyanobacteria bacterium J055]HIK33469.1 mechanosensitive ion channel [Oscillatoriales cyanobacterium M4454_W2019_049]HIK51584.1 mechanosensitive ion channel [Oscillatoriales cyanobacterium M59_W2019_021]